MATSANNVGILNSWSLEEFVRSHGKMKVTTPLTNSQTGEIFKSCAFVPEKGAITLVGFSSKLGELTPAEIKAQKDELQVVQLESGNFKLCKRSTESWQDVDLGL